MRGTLRAVVARLLAIAGISVSSNIVRCWAFLPQSHRRALSPHRVAEWESRCLWHESDQNCCRLTGSPSPPGRGASITVGLRPLRAETSSLLLSSSSSSQSPSAAAAAELRDRLGVHDRFDRWRFLQRLLDEETDARETNRLLFFILEGYLQNRHRRKQLAEQDDLDDLPPERAARVLALVRDVKDRQSVGVVPVKEEDETSYSSSNNDDDDDVSGLSSPDFDRAEELLPDPDEEEDAFKGCWDTVMELHGREAVKINERNATVQWRTRCLAARLLVQYDFLTDGLFLDRD